MRPTELIRFLHAVIPTRQPIYIESSPGMGKSSIVSQVAAQLGYDLCDIRIAMLDPIDLLGLPIPKDGKVSWCTPDFLPTEGPVIVFLDELPQGAPLIQSACLQLVQDRRIGDYRLPEDATVIAAGNKTSDKAGAHRLISPLAGRFVYAPLDVSTEDWHSWAAKSGVASEIRSFIHFKPSALHSWEANSGENAQATPRTWEYLSRILAVTPTDLLSEAAAGAVGTGPGAEFCSFVAIYRDLPDIDDVVKHPATTEVPSELSVIYALAGALSERCKDADGKVLDAVATFLARMPSEYAVMGFRDTLAINPRMRKSPAFTEWVSDKQDMILA
jgi:hypothetical protein